MPCIITKGLPATTLRQAKIDAGFQLGGFIPRIARKSETSAEMMARVDAEEWERESELVPAMPGPLFICGKGIKATDICFRCCGLADALCDWPVGKGKTCDAPMCSDCAKHVGEDLDLCPVHATMWQDDGGRPQQPRNPWPPKRKQ